MLDVSTHGVAQAGDSGSLLEELHLVVSSDCTPYSLTIDVWFVFNKLPSTRPSTHYVHRIGVLRMAKRLC